MVDDNEYEEALGLRRGFGLAPSQAYKSRLYN
jgi:hypothetical protein